MVVVLQPGYYIIGFCVGSGTHAKETYSNHRQEFHNPLPNLEVGLMLEKCRHVQRDILLDHGIAYIDIHTYIDRYQLLSS